MSVTETIGGEAVERDDSALMAELARARDEGRNWTVESWEQYLNAINPNHMTLGLDRIREVAFRLHMFEDLVNNGTYIVTVAGTNGKGSTCALIAQAMSNQGVNVGLFTSPHLISFNERMQINGKNIDNSLLSLCLSEVVAAQYPDCDLHGVIVPDPEKFSTEFTSDDFEEDSSMSDDERLMAIAELNHATRAQEDGAPELMAKKRPFKDAVVLLSYFELVTLAAVRAFMRSGCELLVLETGLGGRLDAVNVFYNDIAVITSIGMDHVKILGNTSKEIAFEKAGIIKPYGEVVIGRNMDEAARQEILRVAKIRDARNWPEDFAFKVDLVPRSEPDPRVAELEKQGRRVPDELKYDICYQDRTVSFALYFPYPKVPISCAGLALNVIFKLNDSLGFKNDYDNLSAIERAVATVSLPGRMQKVASQPTVYLDVAHNVPAAEHLCRNLDSYAGTGGHRIAVAGMLKDKDVEGVLNVLKDSFDAFYVTTLHTERGESKERLGEWLNSNTDKERVTVRTFDDTASALDAARSDAGPDDTIVVLGSFVTVSEAARHLNVL